MQRSVNFLGNKPLERLRVPVCQNTDCTRPPWGNSIYCSNRCRVGGSVLRLARPV